MNVVAKRTPPPNARSPITNWLEERRFGSVDFVNQSNFRDKSSGTHPTIIEMAKRQTIVMIFAIKASPVAAPGSVVKFKFIFVFETSSARDDTSQQSVIARLNFLRRASVGGLLITTHYE